MRPWHSKKRIEEQTDKHGSIDSASDAEQEYCMNTLCGLYTFEPKVESYKKQTNLVNIHPSLIKKLKKK